MVFKIILLLLLLLLHERVQCSEDAFFICPTDQRPIPNEYVCDGYNDCSTGTDEKNCDGSGLKCQPHEMMCDDVKCMNLAFRCDGHNHCKDGSDEIGCLCQEDQMMCRNGRCINNTLKCDGQNDCGDNTDEYYCEYEISSAGGWKCADGREISLNWRCDKQADCDDKSDEENCDSYFNSCGIGMFNCSASQCIDGNMMCDGFKDCDDNNADEDDSICFTLTCPTEKDFACPEKCISESDVCDGVYDCIDNSDEFNCASQCIEGEFKCISGDCINATFRCNGKEDCLDGSDEFLCSNPVKVKCDNNEFPCGDRLECIPEFSLCDRTEQCRDGSDEQFCDISSNKSCNDTFNGGCQHNCHDTRYYHYCSCNDGYRLNTTDMSSCIDVNECEEYLGLCTHYCVNTEGGFTCSCAQGYTPSSVYGCKANGPPAYLLFTNWYDIQRVNITQGSLADMLLSRLRNAAGIDYHYNLGYVYWTDVLKHAIMRADLNGTNIKQVITQGLDNPEGIAVDWIHNLIYWTDSTLKRIEVSNLDGRKRTILFSDSKLASPKDIIVDPINRWLYWTDKHQIVKASTDGTQRSVLLSVKDYVFSPRSLALDHPTQTLYWIDSASSTIGSCRTDGSDIHTVLATNISNPTGLSVFENRLYWAEKDAGVIYSVDKGNGANIETVLQYIYKPVDLTLIHPLRQPHDVGYVNPCLVNNGGCQFLCLVSRNGSNVTCHCPSISSLQGDQRTCSRPELFLLFSIGNELHLIPLAKDENVYDVELPTINVTGSAINMIDWINDTVYWIDSTLATINSMSLNGNNHKVLVDDGIRDPSGMAVDWINNKIYWIDQNHIFVADTTGSFTAVLYTSSNNDKLTDIAVDPVNGYMYFGVRAKHNSIRRAHLDGSHVEKFHKLNGTASPTLLTIDYRSNRLYWMGDLHMQSMFTNESDFEILLDNEGLASGPTALAMYDDKIYWVDAKVVGDNAIRWISKTPPYDMGILVNNEDHLSALTVCHNERQHLDSHPCWDNNGNCSYLCLAVPADGDLKASCVCPIGYQLAPNGKTCNNYIDNYLVFAAKHRIGRISLDVRSFIDVTLHRVLPSQAPIYVDVDLATNDIYWIDGGQSPGIYRVPAEGGPSQRIIDCGIVRPTALAVDWVGRLLYWADSGTKRIEVSYLNGTNRLVLLEDKILAAEVSSIALDIQEFKMYWTSSITSRVVRANLDGTQSITIINGDKISNPLSIALDKSKLYLADNVKEKIFSYNKDGRNEASVATSTNPKGLAVDDSYVYWFDQSTHIIYKAPKRGVPNEASNERMIDGMNGVVDLKLISRKHWLQRGGFQYPCTSYNPCTHLCLPNSGVIGYNCACPTGIKVNTDHQSCPSTPMVYLLFSTLSSIRRISEDTRNFVDVCLINTFGRPLYIDFYRDFNGGKIMWTDPAKNSIMASNFNGSNIATFIQRIANPQGLSVDKSTGNVYYINGGNSPVIEVISNDGLFKKVLISTTLNNPTGILVHPQTGMMYWIDVDNDGASYIAQARMDGSNISRLIHNSTHQQPTALALDVVKDMLYWFNNANRTVERLPLMSNNTSIEIIVEGVDDINDIAVYGDVMYWSDKSTGRVTRYDIPTGRSFQVYSSDDAHGLVMVSTLPIVSSCTNNAGKCSDLCLPLSSVYYQCACSHGARGSCQEYIGSIQSGTDIVSSSAVTSKSSASSLATISTSSITTVTAPSVKVNRPNAVGQLSQGELAILIMIILLLLVVVVITTIVLVFFCKYKYEKRKTEEISAATVTVKNSLKIKESNRKSDYSASKLGFTPNALPKINNLPGTQVSNTSKLTKPRRKANDIPASNKPVDMSKCNDFEPEVCSVTPTQGRRALSSQSTPPHSPNAITADVHIGAQPPAGKGSPTHPKKYRKPPPIPIEDPSPDDFMIKGPSADGHIPSPYVPPQRPRKVHFLTDEPEPPPIPPKSTACTPTSPPIGPAFIPPVVSFPVPVTPVSPLPMTPASSDPLIAASNPLFLHDPIDDVKQ